MITLSLCMIVKNEEAVLERILESISQAADQIIIVDTGSTDRTKEIAGRYTKEVYDYQWKDNFAAARNYACEKASMDYWMWLDADDVINPEMLRKLIKLKENLDSSTDVVMMKYATSFDSKGSTTFSYYRERIIKNHQGFLWYGRVHEAVPPSGNVLYSDIEIQHHKEGIRDNRRNLRIYESMLKEGEILEPRHQFYYARELYYHEQYTQAIKIFGAFLELPEGWIENKIDACLHMAYCYEKMKQPENAMKSLAVSFVYDCPRAETCCEMGRLKLESNKLKEAIYWYRQALSVTPNNQSGAFIQEDCYNFLPAIQLCICYHRLGDHSSAYYYHQKAQKIKPDNEAVKLNNIYFENLFQAK